MPHFSALSYLPPSGFNAIKCVHFPWTKSGENVPPFCSTSNFNRSRCVRSINPVIDTTHPKNGGTMKRSSATNRFPCALARNQPTVTTGFLSCLATSYLSVVVAAARHTSKCDPGRYPRSIVTSSACASCSISSYVITLVVRAHRQSLEVVVVAMIVGCLLGFKSRRTVCSSVKPVMMTTVDITRGSRRVLRVDLGLRPHVRAKTREARCGALRCGNFTG